MHPYYSERGYTMDRYPETARYYEQAVSLPLHPAMEEAGAARVVEAVQVFFG